MATFFLHFSVFLALYIITRHFLNKIRNFPPSPFPSLPIIGHLSLLKKPIYRTLSKISSKHGPVILLQLGSRRQLVVSSPSIAEECFTKNDVVFANRPGYLIAKHLAYNTTGLLWAPYGDHWRNLRRIVSIEVLSAYRLQMLSAIRLEEVKSMICVLFRNQNQIVDMKTVFFELTLNIMMRMIAGKRYYGEDVSDVEEAKRFRAIHAETFLLGGETIIGDFIPWIKSKKMEKRLIECHLKSDSFMQYLIEEQRRKIVESDCCGEKKTNLIQVLLSLQETEPGYYSDDIIKGIILVRSLIMLFDLLIIMINGVVITICSTVLLCLDHNSEFSNVLHCNVNH
jgi:cytochrome P450